MSLQKAVSPVPEHGWMALVRAVERLAAASDLSDIVAIVRDTARDVSSADGVCFVLREGELCHYVDESAIAPLWKGRRFPMSACIAGWCMQHDETAVVTDVFSDPRVPAEAYRPTFIKSMVLVPVRTTKPVAAIGVYWDKVRQFSAEDLALIEGLGRSASAAFSAVQLREHLKESEHRLAMALDAGGLGAWEFNLASGTLIATRAGKAIFGCRPGNLPSRESILAAIHPDDRAKAAQLFEAGAQPGNGIECRLTSADSERHIEMRGRVMLDANGEPSRVSGVVRDVTEQAHAKERLDTLRAELMRAARLNDLGAMASALAHELNQPLAAASNYMHAAERLLEIDAPKAQAAISKAEAQFVRAKDIIQRIRGFVGQGQCAHQAEDLRMVCSEILELARASTVYEAIKVKLDIPPDLPKLEIDKVQIQQVLLNLLRNAFEAMAESERRRVAISARRDGPMVEVRVADNGPGLPGEILEHLFHPFQTTKEGGMGVGLSLCRRIVEAHGGQLRHQAVEPHGAAFCFTLPVAA